MTDQSQKTFFSKLKRCLYTTHTEIIEKVKESMTPDLPIDRAAIDGLEEGLLGADVGAELTTSIVDRVEERIRNENIRNMDRFTAVLREDTRALIPQRIASTIDVHRAKPFVILVVGVNGTGKTTTIAKLAQRWTAEGKSVLLGAADTFRAAAIEQLQMWADRVGVPMVKHKAGSDPGAVAHETLLVIDGTTGQNGVNQAAAFLEAAKVTGMVVTKLDGTAKGGVILSIMRQFDIPVKFIGVGEDADDLIPFDPSAYVDTLFE